MADELPEDHRGYPESADFSIETIFVSAETAVVALHGQVDLHTAPELRACIGASIDDGATRIVVDLSEATFIDSMTLGVLLGAVKRLRPSNGRVLVVCSDPHIRRVFEITLLDRVFSLFGTRADAVAGAGA